MECINHPGTAAAGTCQDCGKGLCPACVERFEPPACESCLIALNNMVARRLYTDLAVTAGIFLVVAVLVFINAKTNKSGGLVLGLMLAGAYWGWQFISSLPMPALFLSGFGAVLYLMLKLFLSILTGFVVAPWQIYKRIREIRSIRKLRRQIEAGVV